jgi:hypothetical protein
MISQKNGAFLLFLLGKKVKKFSNRILKKIFFLLDNRKKLQIYQKTSRK